jgi:hypothetical protein
MHRAAPSTYAEIHLDHPDRAGASVRILRFRGKHHEELARVVVPKNALRARERIATEVAHLVQDGHLP